MCVYMKFTHLIFLGMLKFLGSKPNIMLGISWDSKNTKAKQPKAQTKNAPSHKHVCVCMHLYKYITSARV